MNSVMYTKIEKTKHEFYHKRVYVIDRQQPHYLQMKNLKL